VVDGVPIENGIGDALVERIIRAHKEKTPWKACIVIPLLPGYTYPIDSGEGSSVRLIMECQNRTISRGSSSIFSRLRKEGIDVSPTSEDSSREMGRITDSVARGVHDLLFAERMG
jgi:phospholipase D1/2